MNDANKEPILEPVPESRQEFLQVPISPRCVFQVRKIFVPSRTFSRWHASRPMTFVFGLMPSLGKSKTYRHNHCSLPRIQESDRERERRWKPWCMSLLSSMLERKGFRESFVRVSHPASLLSNESLVRESLPVSLLSNVINKALLRLSCVMIDYEKYLVLACVQFDRKNGTPIIIYRIRS